MENGAFAPEPIQLSTDALFSAPMLSMGRRRVQGVKMLRDISRGALKENRPRIDNIIKLYEKRTWKHQNGRKHRRQINEQTKGQALHRQNQSTLQQNNNERRRAKIFRHSFGRSESRA